jgi:hypothetical protein
MSFASLMPETARIERYAPGLDDRGDESGGAWNEVATVPARFQEIFAITDKDGRQVNILRWQCYMAPADVTVQDRIINVGTTQEFTIEGIDREFAKATLHHLTIWMSEVVD